MKKFSGLKQKKYRDWQSIIGDWEASHLTQANYCAAHHLSFATFKSWRSKLTKNHETEANKTERFQGDDQCQHPEMIPVKIVQGIDLHNSFNTDTHQVRIEFKSGIVIYIPTGD